MNRSMHKRPEGFALRPFVRGISFRGPGRDGAAALFTVFGARCDIPEKSAAHIKGRQRT